MLYTYTYGLPTKGADVVTARDVARLAGVSQATVSRVLNNHPSVNDDTRARVHAALAETGYQPNVAARTMRTQRSQTVGLVVDDVTNPFYPEMIKSISAELAKADLRMALWDSAGPGEEAAIEAIDQRLIDGLIFTTATEESEALHRAIRRRRPAVLVNRTVEGLSCDRVDTDNAEQTHAVARYFARAGHRKVAMIEGTPGASTALSRAAGFRAGCAEYGLDLVTEPGDFAHDRARIAMGQILDATSPAPTAVLCANDYSALGALDELRARGIAVPEQMWVVGFDDIAMASWETFSLTTVRQPIDEMAAAAVQLLVDRIDNPDGPLTHRRFRGRLMPRRTTGGVEEE